MSGQLFREKSLEKISSPEQINDYIKTSGLSIWLILSAIIVLILGAFVWGVFGKIETTLEAVTVCENGQLNCYIGEEDIDVVAEDTVFKVDDREMSASSISKLPLYASDTISPYAMHVGGISEGEWVYVAELNSSLTDGIYKTKIVVERVSPISLLLN